MNDLKYTQGYVVYKAKDQGVYAIKETDWERLKRLISRIAPKRSLLELIASWSFGVTVSSTFALLGFRTIDNVENWIWITTWVTFFVSGCLCIISLIIDQKHQKVTSISTENILNEMDDIEKTFEKSEAIEDNSSKVTVYKF